MYNIILMLSVLSIGIRGVLLGLAQEGLNDTFKLAFCYMFSVQLASYIVLTTSRLLLVSDYLT